MSNQIGKKVVIVATNRYESSPAEESPEIQLKNSGYSIVVVDSLDHLTKVLGEDHNTVILLADAILAKNSKNLEDCYQYQHSLVRLACKTKLFGLGINADSYFCNPSNADIQGVSVVITGDCCNFGIRDWAALLAKVEKKIDKRAQEEAKKHSGTKQQEPPKDPQK